VVRIIRLKIKNFFQSGLLLVHQFSKKLQGDQAWSGQNWLQTWCGPIQCWSVLISAASGLGLEMARFKIFQARTAHSPQHSAHYPPGDWQHLFIYKAARPSPAKRLAVLSILSPEAKYLQGLFCLLGQSICWDYFVFRGTWLVEVDTSCDKRNKQSCMLASMWKPKTLNLRP